jgi:hypothetical protein
MALATRLPESNIPANTLELINIHHALWDRKDTVNYKGNSYNIYIPSHEGFASAIIPNSAGKNFLWITQNLNKPSYGSLEIKRSRSIGDDKRITWIVDNEDDKFKYVGLIKTCDYFDGLKDIVVEKYHDQVTEIVYTNDPGYVVVKSKY